MRGIHAGGLTSPISAIANGFSYANSHAWSNLGQGAPEVGPIPGAPDRPTTINMQIDELEYAPTTGVKGTDIISLPVFLLPIHLSFLALREAIARMYNETYRKGMSSQYTFENICVVPGGRAGLSRVAAVIGDVCVGLPSNAPLCRGFSHPISYLGFQVPDYTAYAQSLEVFRRLVPIPTP